MHPATRPATAMPPEPGRRRSDGAPRRVLVLGCPGAGKSTLARFVAEATGLPLVHLDRHFWSAGWVPRTRAAFEADLDALLEQPSWVMDGNYGRSLLRRLAAADTVVFLDMPLWLCLLRVGWRVARLRGRTRPDMADGCPERLERAFLAQILRFPRNERPLLVEALQDFAGRLHVLCGPRQAAAFRRSLPDGLRGGGVAPDTLR